MAIDRPDIQPQLLRKMTNRRLLEVLMEQGPSSRAELTRRSGISAPTVSKAVASLLEAGLLEEGDFLDSGFGRPGRLVQLATKSSQVVGVVLDARRCRVVAAGLDGKLLPDADVELPTPGDYDTLIGSIAAAAKPFLSRKGCRTLGVGISTPGLINRRQGTVAFSPNLRQTNGRSPAADLAAKLGVACVMVQETHALCIAERMAGDARGHDDFAMLDVSTGLGLGVFSNGEPLAGHSGLAGELGHVTMDPAGRLCGCGNHGCLETLATDTALAGAVSERIGRMVDIDETVRLVRSGQATAESEIRRAAEYLSIAMAAAINLFNPAMLFVYGRLLEVQDGLFESVVELTRRRALVPSFEDCRIRQARGSKRLGAVGGIIQHLTDLQGPSLD